MKINSIIDLVKDLDTSRQTKNLNKLLIRILLHLQVEFSTGFVTTEEKFIILSGAYAFIYPSIYEGFGLPVLESITYKIPTVTSNISSLPEVVGQAAILMNPNNIDSIYNALKEVLYNENTRLILVERCSKQAKKFSWEITAKMTENVYDKYQVVK